MNRVTHNNKEKTAHSSAFTIVELLIVIVVIAILAAITIVSYAGITNRANDTSVQSDVSSLYKAIVLKKIESGNAVDISWMEDQNVSENAYKSLGFSSVIYGVDKKYGSGEDDIMVAGVSKSDNVYVVINGVMEKRTSAWSGDGGVQS